MPNGMINVVILAAGKGTRMYSYIPKCMHFLAGIPMIQYVINTVLRLNPENIYIVYGHEGEKLKARLAGISLTWVRQKQQLGTGHAVKQAVQLLSSHENVLILCGDVPMISKDTLERLCQAKKQREQSIALLSAKLEDPTGYGRIVYKNGSIATIIEQDNATREQLGIKDVYAGAMVAHAGDMKRWLAQLKDNNSQGEYLITDVVSLAYQENYQVSLVYPNHLDEMQGVNNRSQLAAMERNLQSKQASKLMLSGVTLIDPERFDLRGELDHGIDIEIDINVTIEGKVMLGNGVKIGAGCIIRNSTIAEGSEIKPYSIIEGSSIAEKCSIGPFAHLRAGCVLDRHARIGNFVEAKNTSLGEASKASHLSYLGDSEVGKYTNIGAGSITCNYDGANKEKTIIGDNVFVGCATQFVAPITIANDSTIAAGTTVTQDVSGVKLVYNRKEQHHKVHWRRPTKKK
jgi:bifunctional UDP-N-acetylglucosamine pyrophosphorylase/glucosamine-1-phosphate N-acetyltransferase